MNKHRADYQVVPFPKLRRVLEIMYPSVKRKPMIHGLLEVDVTKPRAFLHEYKAKTGESLSFTAFVICCLARAVDEEKSVQALHKGGKRLVIFDDVDVAMPIERVMGGQKQPIVYIIRAANKKTLLEIHREIRAAQIGSVEKAWVGLADLGRLRSWPMPLIRVGWWIFCWLRRTYPQVQKRYGGTVGLTTVGMFAKGGGWGIPLNDHTLDITLGGIGEKLSRVDGQIASREKLDITLSFDHAIIDGAPATRFTQRLRELIEGGYGLCESGKEDTHETHSYS